ncbi:MAG: type IV secretion system DNA-binding domain-containing protein [Candidatus Wolfebacteria bacterium]|nr:type IV secretion system DNA-binding domain-containing protein [Candidatus Wolfebacteria bacterium]
MDTEKITICGETNFRGKRVKFGIKKEDRSRHMYVIGKTGTGKTSFLENMAIDDIRNGRGVAVIDPHGEFAEKMLDYVPEERINDIIYFNPSDLDYPMAFNVLEQVSVESRHLVASGIMGVFKKIWPDVWSARMEYILNNTLLALLEYPGSTLLGIMRMLAEKDYRNKIVDSLTDPVIKSYWKNEFDRYTQRQEVESVAAIQNKVGQFVSNPLIRNIVGQAHSTINMRKIMDDGKIFIANISKGKVGEDNSALLGAMLITKLQLAAMSRVDIPSGERRDFYVYVDEFQNFSTESFANILSEARKYRLNLILAHQYIGQLVTSDRSMKVRDAVFGNVGTIVSFRVGAEDAEFLEKEFMPEFLMNDLVNLANRDVYIKLMVDGVTSQPFSARTCDSYPRPHDVIRDVIIESSRNQYSVPRAIVEEKIAKEWTSGSDRVEERIQRRDEMPLSSVLNERRPDHAPFEPHRREEQPRKEFKEKKAVNMEDLRKAIENSLKVGDNSSDKNENLEQGNNK